MDLSLEDQVKSNNLALNNAKKILLEAILAEKDGNFEKSVQLYKQCYKIYPDIDSKTAEFIEIEGLRYNHNGNIIENNFIQDYEVIHF